MHFVKKMFVFLLFGLLPTFCAAAAAADEHATRSDDPLPDDGTLRIGYANIGGHPEDIGTLLGALKRNHLIVVAEMKKSCLDGGSLSEYEPVASGGKPLISVMKHDSVHRGMVSKFKVGQHDNKRPFFYGAIKVNAESSLLVGGVHLKSADAAAADVELATVHHELQTAAEELKTSHILIIGDFNRAGSDHEESLEGYEGSMIFAGGGHSDWHLDRVYYFHKRGVKPLKIKVKASAGNHSDHGHVGLRLEVKP